MIIKKYILSFLVGIFIFATLVDISKVLVTYSIYYYDYHKSKEACYNEKPDMFDSGRLYLKALIKRVNDICPNHKPKPPKVESSNMTFYVNQLPILKYINIFGKRKNRFVYRFSYDYQNQNNFFRPPIREV